MKFFLILTLLLTSSMNLSFAQNFNKDQIRITGSASVYPIISYIYEYSNNDVKKQFKKNPIIESVGTGAGFDVFCKQKFGSNSPDIINASRLITENERANCASNGITSLHKITVGLDGIILAYIPSKTNSKIQFNEINLSMEDLHLALSKYVVKNNQVVLNGNKLWSDIREDLPKTKIIIYGPNSNSGTYDFFKEIIQKSCLSNAKIVDYLKANNQNPKDECSILRAETFTQLPDQDSTIARKIELQNFSIGILRFSFFENSGKFTAVKIDNIEPTESAIISGKYKISRPLFIYYDGTHLSKVQGLREFLIQIAKFSYRDIIKIPANEYNNAETNNFSILMKKNEKECEENKKVINFEFNCK